ncbi:MAG: hypothetical protein US99_C0082G0004 [Candidatus Daviesbacteria bacterium GW2011_GWF2_38_6]|uniref:Transposase IS200-like domain-containing protein n=1 Tax=Candidatus Daviesbacteria bacterium GW2011_GWF2_38_6 TaxID=1618432 RepID=A0A0G0KBI0_9BACT|nr:MAG: hypothetical protein US99_C0082G0004 [Candidatus Daviesbacteria bacterium GW2011_GWF2_38_6]
MIFRNVYVQYEDMPYRKVILAKDQIYHIYNRGVARLPIFYARRDYLRFLSLTDYYRFINAPMSYSRFIKLAKEDRNKILQDLMKEDKLLVELFVFCLMPNHYHFLMKQLTEKGISTFMSNLQNSYAKYLNIKNDRVGPLFQSMFKAVRIESDEQLIHVSRYIHLNPSTGYLVEPENLLDYPWSSLEIYLKDEFRDGNFVQTKFILDYFKNKQDYHRFILDQADYQRELANIKHITLENNP